MIVLVMVIAAATMMTMTWLVNHFGEVQELCHKHHKSIIIIVLMMKIGGVRWCTIGAVPEGDCVSDTSTTTTTTTTTSTTTSTTTNSKQMLTKTTTPQNSTGYCFY